MTSTTIHDLSGFPLVHLRPEAAQPGYGAAWCNEMTALLDRGTPFVLIYPAGGRAEEGHEDRKQRGLWMKQNRATLAERCAGLIVVEPDAVRRAALEAQFPGTTRAFGVAQMAVPSMTEAEAAGRRILADRGQADAC